MIKHGKKVLLVVGVMAALGAGGATMAQAGSNQVTGTQVNSAQANAPAENASGPDTDNVQSGDQTTPDGTETKNESESSGESSGSEVPNDDGPGGHADEPGNANADHQFSGSE